MSIRTALLDARAMSDAEIAEFWPGGASNPERDVEAWLYAHFNLARFSARAEARQEYNEGAHAGRSDQLLNVQMGLPRVLPLAVPLEIDGVVVRDVRLHYKSWPTLRRMATLASVSNHLIMAIEPLEGALEYVDLIVEAQEWRDRILQMLLWAAISDAPHGKGYGLPWDPTKEMWPEIPEWLDRIDVADVLAINVAHAELHGRALLAIAPFLKHGDDERDPLAGWETFFASYATEKGLEARMLMEDRAFLPFLTQVSLASHSVREARKTDDDTPQPSAG